MLEIDQGNGDIVEELAKIGASVHLLATDGRSVLDFAAHAGYPSITETLISYGANVHDSRVFCELYIRPRKPKRRECRTGSQQ